MIELLKELLGNALTEEMIKEIEAYLAENYVDKAEFDEVVKNSEASGKGENGNNAVMQNDALGKEESYAKTAVANVSEEQLLEIKAEVEAELQAEYDERVYAIEFDYAVNIALLKIGVVDLDLVKVKLDMTKLSMNESGEISGLEEQIEEIRQQFPMLFVDNADLLPANFYGLKPLVGQKNYSAITREDINNMNYKERLALLKSNPSLYHALVG